MRKRTKIFLGGIIILLAAAVLFAAAFLYMQKRSLYQSEQAQKVFAQLEQEETKGLFCAMFSLESYDVNDFATYRGIQTVMLDEVLQDGKKTVAFLKQALQQEQTLEAVYVGLKHTDGEADWLQQLFSDSKSWEAELLELIKEYPQIRFHLILEYPSVSALAELSEEARTELFCWYQEMAQQFTPQSESPNMVLFLPGAETWLTANTANYLENGEPNTAAARFVLGQMICNDSYTLTSANADKKLAAYEEMLAEYVVRRETEPGATYVFFGDSVIGNYTDSMSVPGVVGGYTGARVINCGHGGLAASAREDGRGLAGVIDAFFAGETALFEEDKAVKAGIQTFYEALPQIDREKLTFFISIGLNDYMSGYSLSSYRSAVTYAVKSLQKAYPESEIVLMTPNFIGLYENGTQKLNGYTLEEMADFIVSLAVELDVRCIDVFHELGIQATNKLTYLADMCHPNEFGRYQLGRLVYEHLAKWYAGEECVEASAKPLMEGFGVYADSKENLENNLFFDALVYTGYNIEKHRSDGLMWHYVLAAHKRGKGWLSDITYNGGSEGYETTAEGTPDIAFFEKHGLVCASYATYVYFNYLPNIGGVDTSELTKPELAYNANDWYLAAQDWVEKGYSEKIDFEASLRGGFIQFEEAEEIPIGSIIAFCDARNKSDYCSHVVIYAGYENGYHWVFHVGNENGPEFCSVERMHFGPDPQWPIAVITTPVQVLSQ